jgi:predicted transcriptional regulator
MRNRSRADIVAAILHAAKDGEIKTRIMQKSFLSQPQLEEYLQHLVGSYLLEVPRKYTYRTTEKGLRYLQAYKQWGYMLYPKSFSEDLASILR